MNAFDDDTQTTSPQPDEIRLGRPFLVVLQAPAAADVGRIIMITDRMSIGRSADSHVSIKDSGLSRRHVEITRTAERCAIRDLGSRNGTKVNGAPVEAIDLQPGDQIQVGATLLQFQSGAVTYPMQHRIASSGVALWEYDASVDAFVFSEQVDVALDLPPSTLGRKRVAVAACVHPEDLARVRRALAELADRPLEVELRLVAGPSLERWVICRGQAGGHSLVTGSIVDITGLKRREATLARSALMFDSFLDGVVLADQSGAIVDVNRAMAQLLGRERVVLIGKHVLVDILGDDEQRRAREVEAAIEDAGRWTAALELPTVSDHRFEVLVFPLRTDLGEHAGGAWVFRDVTEKHKLETQIAFLDRLASLGTLSAGIAHEINNPLAFILGNAEHVRDQLRHDQAQLVEAMQEIAEGAHRIAGIVRDLKVFARSEGSPHPRATDVARAIDLACRMTAPVLRSRARVVTAIEPVPAVSAIEPRLVQVLVNLLMNAAEAIPAGAQDSMITISAAPRDEGVEIAITDTGTGMTPEVAARAFEPFFTTKPVVGTGLGLSICHGLIADMGGRIALASNGQGTRATVWLRGTDIPVPVKSSVRAETEPVVASRLRILVIDDEPMVVRTIARMLRVHDVVTAGGYRSAAEHLFAAREHFDVVLCDLMMPDGTGMDLHARMLAERPELAPNVVFVTGGAFTEESEEFLRTTTNECLLKPVDGDMLRRAIAKNYRA